MSPPTVEQLCIAYHNEDFHSYYVARLALKIFDATSSALRIAQHNRSLLETAAQLHDIGYFSNPQYHALKGAEIVIRKQINGFSTAQCRTIASIIALHQYKKSRAANQVAGVTLQKTTRIRRLAAILRVADGLDHSHMQDAGITGIRKTGNAVSITVSQGWYDRNCLRAEEKADLWNTVFPLQIKITAQNQPKKKTPFSGVVHIGDSVIAGFHNILYSQYRTMLDNQNGAFEGTDPVYLHDFRIALRRFRTALGLLNRLSPSDTTLCLNQMLSEHSQSMGQARDADVWLDYVQKKPFCEALKNDPQWKKYLARLEEQKSRNQKKLRILLRSRKWKTTLRLITRFLRNELSDLQRTTDPVLKFRDVGAARLSRFHKRLKKRLYLKKTATPESMHKLRKFCRRERYYAEFFCPVLKTPALKLAKNLRTITSALGEVHDMDVALEQVRSSNAGDIPLDMYGLIKKRRKTALANFNKAWKLLNDKDLKHACTRSLI
ncbi:MAG: CHAD domain-containing protein [Chitinivibrionales bacterium]|nr:CHAD domain-containing protein [Chitinivibrionales bacterium]